MYHARMGIELKTFSHLLMIIVAIFAKEFLRQARWCMDVESATGMFVVIVKQTSKNYGCQNTLSLTSSTKGNSKWTASKVRRSMRVSLFSVHLLRQVRKEVRKRGKKGEIRLRNSLLESNTMTKKARNHKQVVVPSWNLCSKARPICNNWKENGDPDPNPCICPVAGKLNQRVFNHNQRASFVSIKILIPPSRATRLCGTAVWVRIQVDDTKLIHPFLPFSKYTYI